MFRIVRFDLLVKNIVLVTICLSIAIYVLIQDIWFPNFSLFKIITITMIVTASLMFVLISPYFSRKLWGIIAHFDKTLFPDLNGTWHGEIIPDSGNPLDIRAVIRQSLLSTQIDVHGETTKSITLETTPAIEQGQQKLYYMYRSTPKNPAWPSYNGSTLFDVRKVNCEDRIILELSGHYYTDRKTLGRIYLRQVCNDSNGDVSFY